MVVDVENYQVATTTVKTDSGKNHQQILKQAEAREGAEEEQGINVI